MGSLTSRLRRSRANSEETSRDALEALRRIVQALRVSSGQAHLETGLSGAQLFVLQQLRDGALSINDLAARTHTHQSSVSAVVQRLEQAGYLERLSSPVDRRRTEASLTLRGRTLLSHSPDVAQDALLVSFQALRPKTRSSLAKGLVQLADGMGLEARAPMFFEESAPRPPARPKRG